MEEILRIIMEYVSIWAPSLVAVLGVVITILTAISKTKDFINTIKNDVDFKAIKDKLEKTSRENEELVRCNKLLLDQITKIKDYADNKKMEE